MAADLPARLQALADCGLPDVIVHGDAHPGNARIGSGRPVLFDWSDSFIGNPMWDLRRVLAGEDPDQALVRDHWLERWTSVPGADPCRAADLVRSLAPLLAAWTYQGFLDGIEPSEHCYHQADVATELARAVENW